MTDGTSQGLFIVVAIVIFGIFVALSYTVFGSDGLSGGINNLFSNAVEDTYDKIESKMMYVQATDTDFTYIEDETAPNGLGYFNYTGSDEYIILPTTIHGEPLTNTYRMFSGTQVKGVAGNISTLTDMSYMFIELQSESLDLSRLNTNRVTNMRAMFRDSRAKSIDLSNFNTQNVESTREMFRATRLESLDLSSFDTRNVTNMWAMFRGIRLGELELSNFDTSNVIDMRWMFSVTHNPELELDLSSFDTSSVIYISSMFSQSQSTKGYARTQTDADRFNNSSDKPNDLIFELR